MTGKVQSWTTEFAVEFQDASKIQLVKQTIEKDPRTLRVDMLPAEHRVVIESQASAHELLSTIRGTGVRALILGQGASMNLVPDQQERVVNNLGTAVCMLKPIQDSTAMEYTPGKPLLHARGVVRIVQVNIDACMIDISVGGLEPNHWHRINVYEYGDLSDGVKNTGQIYGGKEGTHSSMEEDNIGPLLSNADGNANLITKSSKLDATDLIGRSVIVERIESLASSTETRSTSPPIYLPGCSWLSNFRQRWSMMRTPPIRTSDSSETCGSPSTQSTEQFVPIAYGVIAKSSGLFENKKQICTCSGLSIFEEAESPSMWG